MNLRHHFPTLLLLIIAVASSFALWRFYRSDEPQPLTGPPRSDYFLVDFELVALNEEGKESFSVSGPHLSRHPHLGTLFIEQPRFRFPTENGEPWTARAHQALASADGEELHLEGAVAFDGPADGNNDSLTFRTEFLSVYPKDRRAASDEMVEFTSSRSILSGRGFRADMNTRRFQLLSEVKGHYETPASAPHR